MGTFEYVRELLGFAGEGEDRTARQDDNEVKRAIDRAAEEHRRE